MPLITWGPSLETGIAIIDAQHKRLVDIINDLDGAQKAGRSHEIMGAMLAELVDYTHLHFGTEEKLLVSHDYEDYDAHRRAHRVFTDQIEMDRDRFVEGNTQLDTSLMEFLRSWLINHIAVSDQAYVPTLRKTGEM